MSCSTWNAVSSCCARPHASIRQLNVTTFGLTPASSMHRSTLNALSTASTF
tara:strand:- start:276 stop:428 length:153 start_codon:yes stop_codon:yes gene_type:complete